MEVFYKNKKIFRGEFLKIEDTKNEPKILLNNNQDTNKIYTLIIHDPNAVGGNKIHWARINILNNDIKNGIDIIPYEGPAPPNNTGIHHYKFELYEQSMYHNVKPLNERFFTMDEIRDILKLKNTKPILNTEFKIQTDDQIKRLEYFIPIAFAGLLIAGIIFKKS